MKFAENMENYKNVIGSLVNGKRQLFKLAEEYNDKYLIQSVYIEKPKQLKQGIDKLPIK